MIQLLRRFKHSLANCVSFFLLFKLFLSVVHTYIHTRPTPSVSLRSVDEGTLYGTTLTLRRRHVLSPLFVSLWCQPPQLQEQRDDQYVALERRRNGSYVIGRLWCSWGAKRGRGKGTFSRRFLERSGGEETRSGSDQICPAMSAKRWWDEGWPLDFPSLFLQQGGWQGFWTETARLEPNVSEYRDGCAIGPNADKLIRRIPAVFKLICI